MQCKDAESWARFYRVVVTKQHRQILDLSAGEQDFPQSPVYYQARTQKKLCSVETFSADEGQEKALRCT